jgi:hypothetical protein
VKQLKERNPRERSGEEEDGDISSKRRFKRVDLVVDVSDEQGLSRQQIKEALE